MPTRIKLTAIVIALSMALTCAMYDNLRLRNQLQEVRNVVAQVEREIQQYVEQNSRIPSDVKAELSALVGQGADKIVRTTREAGSVRDERRNHVGVAVQAGHTGQEAIVGFDYNLYTRRNWRLCAGAVVSRRARVWGPTLTLAYSPLQAKLNLALIAGAVYNVRQQEAVPFVGIRLPL